MMIPNVSQSQGANRMWNATGQREVGSRRKRLGNMSIETLMSTADAAGYVMATEDELPDTFGRKPSLFDFKSVPATALAIWRPVVPSIDGKPSAMEGHATYAWHWLTGRFNNGATA